MAMMLPGNRMDKRARGLYKESTGVRKKGQIRWCGKLPSTMGRKGSYLIPRGLSPSTKMSGPQGPARGRGLSGSSKYMGYR